MTKLLSLLSASLFLTTLTAAAAMPRFAVAGNHFTVNGKPFVIISGSMHYPRVPRAYWRDRMEKMKAMGCNTLCTYVFWNMHEPRPGHFDFRGNLDLAAYLRTAQEEGLFVILRPGPYICTEWDFGGFPAWLLKEPGMKVRSRDPRFLAAADRYLKRVGQEVDRFQNTQGGPIILVQVENEYGSFGHDHIYMAHIRDSLKAAGFDVPLYTADGPGQGMLSGGTLPDCLSAINFGGGAPRAFATFAKFRQDVPRMCGEFWVGWFDHWGARHQTVSAAAKARDLDWMLAHGISVNIYMVHGGTSWGWMSGANYAGAHGYEPDITSYDYDAPIDEAGRPTPKFWAFRKVIQKHLPPGTKLPDLPAPLPRIAIPPIHFTQSAKLSDLLGQPVTSERPLNMEALDQSYGYILYRTTVQGPTHGTLVVHKVHDYARVYVDGRLAGVIDRRLGQSRLPLTVPAGRATLDILVVNMGRINFSRAMLGEKQGILGSVTLDGRELTGWKNFTLPMKHLGRLRFQTGEVPAPAFHCGTFELAKVGDTFLDMRGWGKGNVWVNGHNLGRYWSIGPQQTLFCPAPWLKQGENRIIVLDVTANTHRTVAGLTHAIWQTKPDKEARGSRN